MARWDELKKLTTHANVYNDKSIIYFPTPLSGFKYESINTVVILIAFTWSVIAYLDSVVSVTISVVAYVNSVVA